MGAIVPAHLRATRRRLERMTQRSRDPEEVRRALAILRLGEGRRISEVALLVSAARSSVYRWVGWFDAADVEGLRSAPRGRSITTVTDAVEDKLVELLQQSPLALGYVRGQWSSEMLAKEIHEQLGVRIHASTVRRLLPRLGYGWRRARPFLFKRDPLKSQKMRAIQEALDGREKGVAVFYLDEVDIDLNPKIGYSWRPIGRQELVPTPGTNQKRYLAGALNAHTGKVVYAEAERKRSGLFISLLEQLRRAYRGFRKLVLILDNVNTHSSKATKAFLTRNPKFELLFQPVYHPWVNRIERLWKALHDTVTRNHRFKTMDALMAAVRYFLQAAQPFPGAGHGLAKVGS